MKTMKIQLLCAAILATLVGTARADITIGVSLPLTGPASGLGIPAKNGLTLWPATVAGEKINLIVLDDATDPTLGVKNARRFVTEDKADLILGSIATPVAIPIAEVAAEAQTVQLALSPIPLPAGKDHWSFRLAHSAGVMGQAMVEHMKKQGVKTIGFIGYNDAYGESWLRDITPLLDAAGIKMVATERFARSDTGVTAQALKLTAANPDAILVVASGSGAAMPQLALAERGYKGKIYQTHAAATKDLMRIGGKTVEGTFVSAGPAIVAEALPDSNPSKKQAMTYAAAYDKAFGPGSRNQFGAHSFDAYLLLEAAVPGALKKGKPGTPAFRAALRDELESLARLPVSQGVLDYKPNDHWGFTPDTGVMLKVVNGDWKVE
ncbi:ABC transporter substrate-binding protein [Rivibacter subsaxonicus]|uniref:Amino acid/amide ABC transporter substrate-binding protein (HAAT family) n=1 Tax=Rivibacter subsaxonicus TaxID=457575 RepID=A0A4Q7VVM5_9BURK|nr:ABC transporter substrate-binding protein [Rivibacter subsaxonicus]RZU00732.1 amino acid/amide ABC transporter substrate-binding protein (HAAT family) [Rivibacter subsaxonicus]